MTTEQTISPGDDVALDGVILDGFMENDEPGLSYQAGE